MTISSITVFCSASSREMLRVCSLLVPSLSRQNFFENIDLYLVNYAGVGKLEFSSEFVCISPKLTIRELTPGKALGFGEAHNFAFESVRPEGYFLIINPDVYLHEECISRLIETMESSNGQAGIVEARQLPFEHPKEYDRETNETPWASGFGMLVRSEFFNSVGGFDPNFWMYCEDVDLSWRAWLSGYKVLYAPQAVGYHFTGGHFEYHSSRFYIENFWSARNFLYLSYKYWGDLGLNRAKKMLNETGYPEKMKQDIRDSALYSIKEKRTDLETFRGLYSKKIEEMRECIRIEGFNLYHKNQI